MISRMERLRLPSSRRSNGNPQENPRKIRRMSRGHSSGQTAKTAHFSRVLRTFHRTSCGHSTDCPKQFRTESCGKADFEPCVAEREITSMSELRNPELAHSLVFFVFHTYPCFVTRTFHRTSCGHSAGNPCVTKPNQTIIYIYIKKKYKRKDPT